MKIKIEEITTPGCQICARVKEFFEEKVLPKYPEVEIEYRGVADPHAQEHIQKHMIFAAPAIFINEELFSSGGLDESAFLRKIEELREQK